jgi:Domain of unknown function (DUF4404)
MPTPEIIERVRKLNDDLSATAPDPAKEVAIADIQKQLQTVLVEPAYKPHYKTLSDKLLFHYVGFQIDHPQLAGAMEGLANSLTAVGL